MPEIETERLRLRMYTTADADEQFRITSDEQFRRYFPSHFFKPTRDNTLVAIGRVLEHWNQLGFGYWVVELKEESRMVGYCGLRHLMPSREIELLYGIERAQWGKGLTTEAARASLRFGFEEMKFERVMAITDPENLGSRRVMEKAGLRHERDDFYFETPVVFYALNREDYRHDEGATYILHP
ncbi:MAG TPA: GNAT family N-acetyltransferase [Pyrinomonadaceae bacterium]|nr:GNAT family N-acetyltransferase [Pyrinomonadaceae bacterium]